MWPYTHGYLLKDRRETSSDRSDFSKIRHRGRRAKVFIEYSDIGSGLNDGRKGLMRLLRNAAAGRFETVYVTYSDRLARFGTNVIVKALDTYGVGVKVLRTADKKDLQSQVVDDIVALMHSFSGKLYRLRRGKYGKDDT